MKTFTYAVKNKGLLLGYKKLIVLLFSSLVFNMSVFATIYSVNTLDDITDGSCGDGSCSLRDAMLLSIDNDTINIDINGTITLSRHLPDINGTILTINGTGKDNLTIDGNNSCRPFKIYQGDLTLTDLKIVDGNNTNEPTRSYIGYAESESSGGAIFLSRSGSLNLTNVNFSNNNGRVHGGAVHANGSLYINNCTFFNNEASGSGGAVKHLGELEITNSSFTFNEAGVYGGAIDISGSSLITETTFTLNKAVQGGGLYIEYLNPNTHSIIDSEFSANIVSGTGSAGGGIYTSSSLTLNRSSLVSNSAQRGGAIYTNVRDSVNGKDINIINSTISSNSASDSGAGIYMYNTLDCDVKISHSTIVYNLTSNTESGGIAHADQMNLYIKNTILSHNESSTRNYDCSTRFPANFHSNGNNLFSSYEPANAYSCIWINSDINNTQMQVTNTLADNGGKTITHALLENAQANNNATCNDNDGAIVSEDQRGFKRNTTNCDIGAYEEADSNSGLPAMFYLLFN